MTDINSVSFTGRVGADPDLRYSQGGKAILNIRFAVGGRTKVGDQWQDTTMWISTTVWDKRAEALSKLIVKGSRIGVSGTLVVREYDKRDGGKGTSVEVFANDVVLLDGKRNGGAREQQSGPADGGGFEGGGFGSDADDQIPF